MFIDLELPELESEFYSLYKSDNCSFEDLMYILYMYREVLDG